MRINQVGRMLLPSLYLILAENLHAIFAWVTLEIDYSSNREEFNQPRWISCYILSVRIGIVNVCG